MEVLDKGHKYALRNLDGDGNMQTLTFVKREGEGYPGNVGHYEGTTAQEVLRALIDRFKYVNKQIQCREDELAIRHARAIIYHLEVRAAKRHGRKFKTPIKQIEKAETCEKCGHIGCKGKCRQAVANGDSKSAGRVGG